MSGGGLVQDFEFMRSEDTDTRACSGSACLYFA